MSDHERHSDALIECWARALGLPKERLAAIVKEVVKERSPRRQRRLAVQPIE
jgi:hypothetical protein